MKSTKNQAIENCKLRALVKIGNMLEKFRFSERNVYLS